VLLPSLLPSLASEGWEEFLSNLDAMVPEAQDVQAVVQAARIYSAERQARPPREFR
jgi:heme oxygenase